MTKIDVTLFLHIPNNRAWIAAITVVLAKFQHNFVRNCFGFFFKFLNVFLGQLAYRGFTKLVTNNQIYLKTAADLGGAGGGGGGGADASPQEFAPLPTQRVPHLYYIHFWPTDLKNVPKAPLAPTYTNFEGGARQKNAIFWSTFSKRCIKTPFLACFFHKFACGTENFAKLGSL